jgi:hypothetical protein
LLAFKLPLAFHESNERSRKCKNVKQEIFETLKCAATMGEGLEETLRDLRRHTTPLAPAFIIISDCEKKMLKT